MTIASSLPASSKPTAASRRGFSLLETLIAAALLLIGITAVINLFTSAARGEAANRFLAVAGVLAEQRLEYVTVQSGTNLPACGGGLTPGCRLNGSTFAAVLPSVGTFSCTQYFDDADLQDPGTSSTNTKYRVDTVIAPHVDALRLPDVRVVTVSVCWQDQNRLVRQHQVSRMVLPGG